MKKNYKVAEGVSLGAIVGVIMYFMEYSNRPAYADKTFDFAYFAGMIFGGIIFGLILELIIAFFRSRKASTK